MKFNWKTGWLVAAGCAMLTAGPGWAQTSWPNQPVRIIVPFPAGGAGDLIPRILGEHLSKKWGQPVLIENKTGADGVIGIDAVAKSKPDGLTIGVATSGPVAIGKILFPNLPYDPKKDLSSIALTYETPFVLVVNSTAPFNSIADLSSHSKKHPDQVNISIPNNGSLQHLVTEQMKIATGMKAMNVPYKGGGPAVLAVVSGEVNATWGALPNVLPLIKGNKLKAIAVSSATRSSLLPEVATVKEQGFEALVSSNWNGLIAPANTPDAVLEKINQDVNEAMRTPEVKRRFDELGVVALIKSRAEFDHLLEEESRKWGEVIRQANIKAE